MKKKIIIVLVVLLAGGGFVAKSMFLKPAVAKEKIEGTIYILPKQFTANLKDGRYATVTVALVLAPGQSTGAAAGGEGGAPAPPEGFGTLPEEAAVRDIITNLITDQNSGTLTSETGREHLKSEILAGISKGTDVKVHEILFTDLAVQ
jgi:flagellar basal body-associated protein FliL